MLRQLACGNKLCPPRLFVAHYSQPGKKTKPASRLPAQKQTLRKRQKEEAYKNMAEQPSNQKDMLTDALFTVRNGNPILEVGADTLKERETIAKAWSRLTMFRVQMTSSWERAYLQSKMDALQELKIVSPELAEAANNIDYSLPPVHRRLPTDTPPDPSKFPFSMSILH